MNKSPTPFQKMFAPKAVATKPANPKVLPNPVVEKEPLAKVEIAPPTRPPVNDYLGTDRNHAEWKQVAAVKNDHVVNNPNGRILSVDVSGKLPYRRLYGWFYATNGGALGGAFIGAANFWLQDALVFSLQLGNADLDPSGQTLPSNTYPLLSGEPFICPFPFTLSAAEVSGYENSVRLYRNTNVAGALTNESGKAIWLHPFNLILDCDKITIDIKQSQNVADYDFWLGCLSTKLAR